MVSLANQQLPILCDISLSHASIIFYQFIALQSLKLVKDQGRLKVVFGHDSLTVQTYEHG
jgi:ABC-type uncharacterized transport system ATPase subunit